MGIRLRSWEMKPADATGDLFFVERLGEIVGMMRRSREGKSVRWEAFSGSNGSEVLIGDFLGQAPQERALRRVLDYTRALNFTTVCRAVPAKDWHL